MSGLDTQTHKHTHTHTHTQSDYRNPRCACAPRVNEDISLTMTLHLPHWCRDQRGSTERERGVPVADREEEEEEGVY